MPDLLKAAVREMVASLFEIVTGSGTEAEKIAKVRRATEALASEEASNTAIDAALRGPTSPVGALKNE